MDPQQQLQDVVASKDIGHEYFNGFSVSLGSGDVVLILLRHGQPVLTLNTSFTVAKTLGEGLTDLFRNFESITGHEIMTTHFIDKVMVNQKVEAEKKHET